MEAISGEPSHDDEGKISLTGICDWVGKESHSKELIFFLKSSRRELGEKSLYPGRRNINHQGEMYEGRHEGKKKRKTK